MQRQSSPDNVGRIWHRLGRIFRTRKRPTIALPDTSPESPPPDLLEDFFGEVEHGCQCVHRLEFPPLPSDGVFGAILRREIANRVEVERVLGQPSCFRCQFCPGPDVEYWFAKEGSSTAIALVLTYLPNGHLLDFAIVTDLSVRESVRRRCECFAAPAIIWSHGLPLPR